MGCGSSVSLAPLVAAAARDTATESRLDMGRPDTSAWVELGGEALEPWLKVDPSCGGEAPVALLDARFVIKLADAGGTLPRRQELPPEAFIPLEKLQYMGEGKGGSLRIACVSHPWLQPNEPDPKGVNLRKLADTLRHLVEYNDGYVKAGAYAIFFDFASLHQPAKGATRSGPQGRLYESALGGMAEWYAHPNTLVLKLTETDAGRGWLYAEGSLASLVKPIGRVIDVGKAPSSAPSIKELPSLKELIRDCEAPRRPPPTPEAFEAHVATLAFTNKEKDLPLVTELYVTEFRKRMAEVKQLNYVALGWTDDEVEALCKVLATGELKQLKTLTIRNNKVGERGLALLASAISAEKLPMLVSLDVAGNPGAEEVDGQPAAERLAAAGAPEEALKLMFGGD